jgi:hypothetical protein
MHSPAGSLFRIGFSRIGSGDAIASDNDVIESHALMDLLFPNADPTNEKHHNRCVDVDHLIAHKKSGADIFVTTDGAMLNRATQLLNGHGITVMSPKDFFVRCSKP